MDRVNRSMLLASTLLAIPAALLMASLSTGTTPDVQLAVGTGSEDADAVQQVVGKQPRSRQTRPGLLQVITGARTKGSEDHRHKNMPSGEPKGILDAIFDGRTSSSPSPRQASRPHHSSRSHHAGHSQHGHQPTRANTHSQSRSSQSRSGVDWDGIPYHSGKASGNRMASTPIRDPATPAASTSGVTRIIRGGSARSIQAKPASVRKPSGPTLARRPAPPLLVPAPPREVASNPSRTKSFSSSLSSRRSNRREVQALDASEIAAAAKALPPAEASRSDDVVDLVPKVVRKEAEPKPKPQQPKPEPKAAAKPAPAQVAKTKTAPSDAAKKQKQAAAKPEAKAPDAEPPAANTALAAIGTPSPSVAEPKSAGDVAAPPAAAPAYTQPVDPTTQSVPVADIPSRPYAASTPATSKPPATSIPSLPNATLASPPASEPTKMTVSPTPAATASHRAGPPTAAFGPGQIASANDPQARPGYAHPQFNPASTPVGSGVAGNGDVASYRRPSQPAYDTAATPSYRPADPYATAPYVNEPYENAPYAGQRHPQTRRMTTYGQPAGAVATPPRPGTPGPNQNPAVPMRPIQGYAQYASQPTHSVADNFTPSTHQSRNQMRDANKATMADTAAASELPGIRVVTHGPSAIMIRQTSQYEIRVENRGSIDASGVMVRALVPDWAEVRSRNATRGDIDNQVQGSTERLVWTIDHLPAGASEQMFVRLTAARSGTYDWDVDWTLLPQKSVAKVHVHEPRLDLTIEGPDEVVYGQSQTYKVRVLNPGDGTAPNVVFTLSPNSATPQTQRIGDIPPGKEAQFDVELTAQDLGDLKIHGLAAGELELRAESSKTIRVAAAQLEAVLTGPELKYQNNVAMYSLQLQNVGAATSEKIMATLRIPSGVKYLGGIDGAVVQGQALKWEITALAPGATRDYQFRCNMASTGEHLFAFDCQGTAAGHTDVSIATTVESIADLVLSISDPAAPAPIGAEVTYEIVIHNRGSKEATDVRTIAQFSHGIEPQRIEGQSGEVVTGQVLFDPIPRIGAGQEVRMRVIAQADRAGHHRFRTEVRSGDTVLVAEEATHYLSPLSDRVSRRSSDAASR